MRARKQDSERRGSDSSADAAARLAEIVEAAEQAASKVIDDAEEQAREILEEARERADRMVAERLRDLADELAPLPPAADGDGGERRESHLRPVEAATEPTASRSASAGARLLATQMAVSGAGREEIEAKLRNGFEIEDTSAILDAILGPEE